MIDSNSQLIRRVNEIPRHFEEASHKLASLGVQDFVFFGGAVRDLIARRPHNDMDIYAKPPEKNAFWTDFNRAMGDIPPVSGFVSSVFYTSDTLHALFNEQNLSLIHVSKTALRDHVCFSFVGQNDERHVLDISFSTQALSNFMREAPINSFSMTPDGDVYGVDNSLEHLEGRVFQLSEGLQTTALMKAFVRYVKTRTRLPGLELRAPEDNRTLTNLFKFCDNNFSWPERAAMAMREKRHTVKHLSI
jgi:hypothetical protein